jgi:hypothetical protein
MWLKAKTWQNFLMDDLEENCKIEKKKIKKIIDAIIIITIYNVFIYFIFKNKNLKLISKYSNINL